MNWSDWAGIGYVGVFWMLLMAVFWGMIIVGIVFVVRALTTSGRHAQTGQEPAPLPPAPGALPTNAAAPRPEALRILEERYARGEIDREEFLARKKDLLG